MQPTANRPLTRATTKKRPRDFAFYDRALSLTRKKPRPMADSCFVIKPSLIAGAGNGLFTLVDIEPGKYILDYRGLKRETQSHGDHTYCLEWDKQACIDAANTDNIAKYINDAHGTALETNVKFWGRRNDPERYKIVSIVRICAGQELLIAYGDDYWNNHTS